MTQVPKPIRMFITAMGAALPTANRFHRGQIMWKWATGSDDELYVGTLNASNTPTFERVLTKSYADTKYQIVGGIGTAKYMDKYVDNAAVTTSTSDTANYSVNISTTWDLGSGTWTVYAESDGMFSHSVVNGAVRAHLQVAADAGTALVMACPETPSRTMISTPNAAAGLTGVITLAQEYRPNASGRGYAGGGWISAVAIRTA